VEMIATMVARLLEGAPATATTKAAAADPVVGAVLGGMDPQQAIVAGGGPLLGDSNGYPWNGRYIVASGNLLADFRANAAAEAQGRLQTARLCNMTDDTGVRDMLRFNLARDTLHQNLWLKAIEELRAARRRGVCPGSRPEAVRHLRRRHGQAQRPGHGDGSRPGREDQGQTELTPGTARFRLPRGRR
jgi:Mn-containing catalase